ncbi:MAG: SLC13 family permease [Planctomycetota bacterium]|nr:SLC13 family permease [Planctomycetota bacterium]
MGLEAWFTICVLILVIAALVSNRMGMDIALLSGLIILMVVGVVDVHDVAAGFASEAVLMIAGLYVFAAGMQETGAFSEVARKLLGRPSSVMGAQIRLMAPVALMSGFMNNTPIVAMCIPLVKDWAKTLKISPSLLYMPLSFSAILGGRLTMIGTASNLLVIGLFHDYIATKQELVGPGNDIGFTIPPEWVQFFGVAAIGLPCVILGIALIMFCSRWLLPERMPVETIDMDWAKMYQTEMVVEENAPISGQSIEEAGLRNLPGLYLSSIERNGTHVPAVGPGEILQAGDLLVFVGILDSVKDLRSIRGLSPATDEVEKLTVNTGSRTLVEAVVSANSPLVHRTVRETRFRTIYNAAIIAVHRQGEAVNQKIGDIILKVGDTLLLDTHMGFIDAHRDDPDFYLVSQVSDSRPVRHHRAHIAIVLLLLLVALLIGGNKVGISPLVAIWTCALLMVLSRCLSGTVARNSINWQVLISIGAAIGLGAALDKSGAVAGIISAFGGPEQMAMMHPALVLVILFIFTNLLSQLITPYAAAAIMFPFAMLAAELLGVNPLAYVFTLMVAGCNFITPIGYQTNLMVYGPGGYRFLDFTRLGIPLTLLIMIICAIAAPLAFPF